MRRIKYLLITICIHLLDPVQCLVGLTRRSLSSIGIANFPNSIRISDPITHGESFVHIVHEDSFVEAATVLASSESSKSSQTSYSSSVRQNTDTKTTSIINESKEKKKRKKGPRIRRTIREVVASSDGKVPLESLPSSITNCPNNILDKIDAIYHASTKEETRTLFYKTDEIKDNDLNNGSDNEKDAYERLEINTMREALENAGFELMTKRDMDLCEALNSGYLLRLSLQEELEELDQCIGHEFYPESSTDNCDLLFEGRILVYRRGYKEEVTKGRLLLPKLDYLQTSIVQRTASIFGDYISNVDERIRISTSKLDQQVRVKVSDATPQQVKDFISNRSGIEGVSTNVTMTNGVSKPDSNNRIALGRYSTSARTSNLNDALNPFLKFDVPVNQSKTQQHFMCQYDDDQEKAVALPPKRLIRRVSIANLVDFFSSGGRRRLIKSFFSRSKLVEPTYDEVVVLWRPKPKQPKKKKVTWTIPENIYNPLFKVAEIFEIEDRLPKRKSMEAPPKALPMEIRAFSGVPMANILAVMPKTKLLFRPADALIFDLVSIVSFLAVILSQRFDSPKLDLLAVVSVSLWTIRTFFRYSNKLARYDLLVNKFITSRITHRNDGAKKYIFDEASIQRARRATLVHAWLVEYIEICKEKGVVAYREDILREGFDGVNSLLNKRDTVTMRVDIDRALQDLEGLGFLEFSEGGSLLRVKRSDEVEDLLEEKWISVFKGNK